MISKDIQARADSLRVIDDTLFRLIASRREVCEEILRTLLQNPDLVVHQVTVQAVMVGLHREVMLDALCELAENMWMNVEMQKGKKQDDIRRTRFHASAVTVNQTPKGAGFSEIPDVTIIYITEYDALHNGQIFTEVRRGQIIGNVMIPLEDGERICFVNTAVDDGSERAELMRLFLKREAFEHEKFQELSKAVRYYKESEKGRGEMCAVLEAYGMEQWEAGMEEGRLAGKQEGIQFTRRVFLLDREGYTVSDIAMELSVSEEEIKEILGI